MKAVLHEQGDGDGHHGKDHVNTQYQQLGDVAADAVVLAGEVIVEFKVQSSKFKVQSLRPVNVNARIALTTFEGACFFNTKVVRH